MLYRNPSEKLLKKYGFVPTALIGFYHTRFKRGVDSILVFDAGEVSVYEEPGEDAETGQEEIYRVFEVHVSNDRQLDYLLHAALG